MATNEPPWIAAYPPGVRWDTPLPPRRLHEMLDEAVQRWPEHHALDFMGRRLRYRELAVLVRQAARGRYGIDARQSARDRRWAGAGRGVRRAAHADRDRVFRDGRGGAGSP